MKKLLAVMLVLGVASVSNAAYFDLVPAASGLAGAYDFVVLPGVEVKGGDMSIVSDTGIDLSAAKFSGDALNPVPTNLGAVVLSLPMDAPWGLVPSETTPTSALITGGNGNFPTIGAYAIATDLVLQGTTQVIAYGLGVNVIAEQLQAGAVLAEVPEPMTMSLLGLGALGLIRRRRA